MSLLTNLVAYYKLDGNANDSTGSHNGSISGATYTSSGKILGAYLFDGSNDYISTFSPNFGSSSFSISFWFKTSTSQSEKYMIGEYGTTSGISYYVLRIGQNVSNMGTNKLSILLRSSANEAVFSAAVSSGAINDGAWHHAVIIVNRTTNQVIGYVDGTNTLTASRYFAGNFNGSLATMYLGAQHYPTGTIDGYWNGYLDEVAFWDKILTTDEIASLYNNNSGFSYPFSFIKRLIGIDQTSVKKILSINNSSVKKFMGVNNQ